MSQLSLNENAYQKIISFMDDIKVRDTNFRKEILLAFEELFDFHETGFWLCDQQNNISSPISNNVDKAITKDYIDNYLKADPVLPHKVKMIIPKRRVIRLLDLPKKDYEKGEYYNSFLKKYGFYDNIAIFLVKDSQVVGLVDFSSRKEIKIHRNEIMCLEIISRYLAQRFHEHLLWKNTERGFLNDSLTPRESEVLRYVQKGFSNKQIATMLFISVNTVKKHVQSLYEKFEVNNRTSLCFKVHNFESDNKKLLKK